jgi:hypothetical protein
MSFYKNFIFGGSFEEPNLYDPDFPSDWCADVCKCETLTEHMNRKWIGAILRVEEKHLRKES